MEEVKRKRKTEILLASILGIGVTVNAARVPTPGILARDSNGRPAITDTADTQRSPVRLYFTFRSFVKLVHINCDHYVNTL